MSDRAERIEYTTEGDVYHTYCLWEYDPVAPTEGKLRSVNLLYDSFRFGGISGGAWDVVEAIRGAIGPQNTVWGVKLLDGKVGWELYFYDYRRKDRERSMTRVLEAMEPFAASRVTPNENLHYFMFSLDIDDSLVTGARDLSEIHMYIGNVGSTVSSGICYSLTEGGSRLENFYFFFDPGRQRQEMVGKVLSSAHIDSTVIGLNEVLWPELIDCHTVCIANKQANDCAYFSGINVDQFLFFLRKMDYPRHLVSYVEENMAELDHMLYDVGIDYRMEDGELVVLKSGYYGTF